MQKKIEYLAFSSASIFFTVNSMIFLFIVNYRDKYVNNNFLYFSFFLYALGQLFISPIIILYTAKYKKRIVIILSLGFNSILFFLNYMCISLGWFYAFVILRLIAGATDIHLSLSKGVVSKIHKQSQKVVFIGIFNSMKYLGDILGSIFFNCVLNFNTGKNNMVFLGTSILYLILIIIVYQSYEDIDDNHIEKRFSNNYHSLFSLKNTPMFICMAITLPIDSLINCIPLIYAQYFQWTEIQIAYGISIFSISSLISNTIIAPKIMRIISINLALSIGMLSIIITCLLGLLIKQLNYYILMAFIGLCASLISINITLKIANICNNVNTESQLAILSSFRFLLSSSMLFVYSFILNAGYNPLLIILVLAILLLTWLNY